MALSSVLILLLVGGSLSAPADEPVRVDLPVYDPPQEESGVVSQPLEPESYGLNVEKSPIGDLLGRKLQKPVLSPEAVPSGTVNIQGGDGWFAPPISTLEGALLETEGIGSKVLSTKDNLQNVVAGIFQPKPIVDTITEEEKYGNNGDKFYSAGRALVGGAENVSNFVNSVLEVPGTIFRKIANAATEKLNNLGGRLIGL